MGTDEFNAGGITLRWTNIPYREESRNTPSHFMRKKPEMSAGLMGHVTRFQTLPLPRGFCKLVSEQTGSRKNSEQKLVFQFGSLACNEITNVF